MPDAEAITVSVEESQGRQVFRVTGELSISTAGALRSELMKALPGCRSAALDLAGVTEIDLCGLQLLCSAHRTFVRQGADLALEGASEGLRAAARAAGYVARTAICPYRRDDICLWKA